MHLRKPGLAGEAARGFGDEGLRELVAPESPPRDQRQLDELPGGIIEANRGPIQDDVVMLAVSDAPARTQSPRRSSPPREGV